jgi:putative ABC transport system substrate-binding protein
MRRRAFLYGSVTMLAAPRAGGAQQAERVRRVAYVSTAVPLSELTGPESANLSLREFLKALRVLGWIEGKNLVLERRSAEGRFERFGDILRELVNLPCDVIVTTGSTMLREAVRVTTTVPIVFHTVDPLTLGMRGGSLARPGPNVTGLAGNGPEFLAKQLEVLKEALPKARRVAVLGFRGSWDSSPYAKNLREAAAKLGMTLLHSETGPNDYTRAFAAILRDHPDAIYLTVAPYHYADRHQIIDFAKRARVPLMGNHTEFTEIGGLLSYLASFTEWWQRIAHYVDRILRGAKPADLPIEEPSKFELVINLKTAKALGLTIPPSLLARADQVIE